MEKVGVHKRDILVDRVKGARDSQAEARQQFKSALEQFGSVVKLKNTDLKKAYMNDLTGSIPIVKRRHRKFPTGSTRSRMSPRPCLMNGKVNISQPRTVTHPLP